MFAIIDMLIVRPLVNILFLVYSLVGDFGLAIIIFTILVKLATWPLLRRNFKQVRAMRKIQPELAKIKKNAAGNRQLEAIQMMDLYKRNNIKPFRSFLMIFIQLPIFIGLFTAIDVTVRPRPNDYNVSHSSYAFIRPLNHIAPLIEEQNNYFKALEKDKNAPYQFKPLLFGKVDLSLRAGLNSFSSIVILSFALLSAVASFILSRQQSPSQGNSFREMMKGAAKGKEYSHAEINAVAQNQMTFMMPIMMLMIMVSLPGALVTYYLLNNVITIALQTLMLKNNLDEMENIADKKILRELKSVEEAEIVSPLKTKTPKAKSINITRIKASSKKKRRK